MIEKHRWKTKPCPFCGNNKLDIKNIDCDGHKIAMIACTYCTASLIGYNKNAVVDSWNRRMEDKE